MKPTYLASVIKLGLMASVIASPVSMAEEATEEKVERIVVTGLKIDRELQETPTSVAVVTEKQMEDEQLLDLYDVLDQIPNVSGHFGSDMSIRGINAFTTAGGGISTNATASVYVDGAALPYRMVQQGGFSLWDMSQVEVLRGPQSTLQGRNALAGAIWMTSHQPEYEWSGKTRLTLGQHGQREAAVAVGGELIENQMAFRFSGEKNDFDGINKNITRNDTSDFNNNETYRMKFLMEPEAIEGLRATFGYTFNKSKIGVPWVKWDGKAPNFKSRINVFDAPVYEYTNNNLYTLDVDYDFNYEWSLKSTTTYNNSKYGYRWDGDATEKDVSRLIDDRFDKTFSQELRVSYEGESLKAVIGTYYSDLKIQDKFSGTRLLSLTRFNFDALVTSKLKGRVPDQFIPVVLSQYRAFDPVKVQTSGLLKQDITTAAIYSEMNYKINDHWAIYGGLRYDYEKQTREADNKAAVANYDALPDPTKLPPQFAAIAPAITQLNGFIKPFLDGEAKKASGYVAPVDDSFNKLLPKLGVSYFINEDISTHFTFQQGYRSGGVGRNIAQNEIYTYDPEHTNNYELTFRSAWLNNDLVLNANLFLLDWKDMQVTVQNSANQFDKYTRNAGKAQVKGFEVEMFYSMSDEFTFNAGIGQAKSEIKAFVNKKPNGKEQDFSGQSFAKAPEWTANIGLTYKADNGVFANLNANYQDSSAPRLTPKGVKPELRNNTRTIVNARVGYEWENFGVFVTAKNLLDVEYVKSSRIDTNEDANSNIEFGAERQVSLNLTAAF